MPKEREHLYPKCICVKHIHFYTMYFMQKGQPTFLALAGKRCLPHFGVMTAVSSFRQGHFLWVLKLNVAWSVWEILIDRHLPFCSQEIRYFSEEYDNIESLETSLENSPGDVALWLKLARLKLHQSNSTAEGEEEDTYNNNVMQALSTLSRGLEENNQSEV